MLPEALTSKKSVLPNVYSTVLCMYNVQCTVHIRKNLIFMDLLLYSLLLMGVMHHGGLV